MMFRRLAFAVVLLCGSTLAMSQESKSAVLYAEKIFCDACAAVITKALRGVEGVSKVAVDVEKKEVTVRFDPTKTTVEQLTLATAKKGFPSSVRRVEP